MGAKFGGAGEAGGGIVHSAHGVMEASTTDSGCAGWIATVLDLCWMRSREGTFPQVTALRPTFRFDV
jgi:hypothetical protein